jgi:hypothetical protein
MRPFRVEAWAQHQLTMLTYFVSARGMDRMTDNGCNAAIDNMHDAGGGS